MKNKFKISLSIITILACMFFSNVNIHALAPSNQETEEQGNTQSQDTYTPDYATEPSSATGTTTNDNQNGTGSTIDQKSEQKEFYTVKTKSGKVFYIIVDKSKTDNNVYLLTEVSEQDLLNFVEIDEEQANSIIKQPELEEPKEKEETTTDNELVNKDVDKENEEENNNSTSYIFYVIVVLVAVGVGYYFKIYKPKQEESTDSEDWFEDDELLEDDMLEEDLLEDDFNTVYHTEIEKVNPLENDDVEDLEDNNEVRK